MIVPKFEAEKLETARVHVIIDIKEAYDLTVRGARTAVAVQPCVLSLFCSVHLQREKVLVVRKPRKHLRGLLRRDTDGRQDDFFRADSSALRWIGARAE